MLDYQQKIETKRSNDINVTTWGDPDTKQYDVIMELSNRNNGNNHLAYLSLKEARELGESLIKAADHVEGIPSTVRELQEETYKKLRKPGKLNRGKPFI